MPLDITRLRRAIFSTADTMVVLWSGGVAILCGDVFDVGSIVRPIVLCGWLALIVRATISHRPTVDRWLSGPARRTAAAAAARIARGDVRLLTVERDGKTIRSVDLVGASTPSRWARGVACRLRSHHIDGAGRVTTQTDDVVGAADGSLFISMTIGQTRRQERLDLRASRTVRLVTPPEDGDDRRRAAASGAADGLSAAACALVGDDLSTRSGVATARRRAAKAHHPDQRGGGDGKLLAEINALLDEYEVAVGTSVA